MMGGMDEQLLILARKLISIKSVEGSSQGLQDAIDLIAHVAASDPSITVETFLHNKKPSFLAYAGTSRPKHFKLLLNGHVDVVPGKDSLFRLQTRGNVLSGRGTVDMKLATLVLADTFARLAPRLPYAIGLQIVSDEEVGGYDGTGHQMKSGVTADLVIMGEYTNLDICTESKGLCRLRLIMHGRSAHSANLWNGDNAAVRLLRVLNRTLARYPIPDQASWVTTINIASLGTENPAINLVPEYAAAGLDVRFIKDDQNFANRHSVVSFFASIDPRVEIVFITGIEPPIEASANDPLVERLVDSISEVTGRSPSLIRKHGSSDARFYSPHAIVFGPSGAGIHGDDEQVSLSSLREYSKILENFILSLAYK